jgi:quaternary ammonium compound-resistance protein SugE
MPWILLVIAGGLEVIWAVGLKESHGFSWLIPSLISVIVMLGSFSLLGWAVRRLPSGAAYKVWTGIGALGVILAGALCLAEGMGPTQIGCMLAISGGIIGLQLSAKRE